MIYFCADDYGLNHISSMRIMECIEKGALNKVSLFANFGMIDFSEYKEKEKIRFSLHLNLVEGKCMANPDEINLIADKSGNFKHTFMGLFKLSFFKGKTFEEQVFKEIKAQVLHYKNILPKDIPFCIDSHQHTHMIPAVFKALIRVLKEENIKTEYIRIPAEPIMPFIKTPSLYFTYSAVNIIKQWLLKFLWLINKKELKNYPIPYALFFGILFSGRMDEKRVNKILPKYIHLAKKKGKDIEVLFHPGYMTENEVDFKNNDIVFNKFYLSNNRKIEFDSVNKISKGSV